MTTQENGTRAVDQIEAAEAVIKDAAGTLLWARDGISLDDLYRAGGSLPLLTSALEQITSHLGVAVGHAGDTRILYDDAGGDPSTRVEQAVHALREAATGYQTAQEALSEYHNAVGHLGVQADLQAETDE